MSAPEPQPFGRASHRTSPAQAVSLAIGKPIDITKGFAEEWLAWHDERKDQAHLALQDKMVKAAQGASTSSKAAAVAAFLSFVAAAIQAYAALKGMG